MWGDVMTMYMVLQVAQIVMYLTVSICCVVLVKTLRDDYRFYQRIEEENYERWKQGQNEEARDEE